jgi:hypothetical protein
VTTATAPGGGPVTRVVPAEQVLDVVCGGGLALLTLPVLLPLFAGGGAGALVAAALVPVAVAVASVLAVRWAPLAGPGVRLAADVAGVVVLLAFLPADPGGRGALTGLVSGAARLVTAALPATPAGPELGVVAVVVAVAAGLGAELARRTRSALAPALPALLLFAAGVAVGTGGLRPPSWAAVLLVAGAGLTGLLRRHAPLAPAPGTRGPAVAGGRRGGPVIPWRVLAAGVALTAVAAGLALPVGDLLPGSSPTSRYDLRAALRPAVPPPPGLNPLVTYAATYDGPVRPVVRVTAAGADPGSLYWRLDVLDHFTGTGWTSSSALLPAGTTLPPGPPEPVRTSTVTAQVDLQAPTTYLPAPDRPTAVSVPGLRVAPATGVLAVGPGGRPPGSYRVRAAVAAPTTQQLLAATAVPVDDPGGAAPPGAVSSVAFPLVARVPPVPFARLTAIQAYLTGPGFRHHPPGGSPIGSGSYQVEQLLTRRDGSAEQYASTFALLARAEGYDARIVIGYRGGTREPRTGAVQYTTRDLTVWPEVQLSGIGWQPFPATPAAGSGTDARPAPAPPSALSQALQQQASANAAGTTPRTPSHPPSPPARRPAPGGAGALWWAVPLGVVLVGAALLAGLLGGKALRRRRQRRRPDPGEQVEGAWACVLDRLVEHGVTLAPSLTVPEVADRAAASCGAARVGPLPDLVAVVDARRYNPMAPPSPAAADLAWTRTEEVERCLRRGLPLRRRLRVALSPAPLLRR